MTGYLIENRWRWTIFCVPAAVRVFKVPDIYQRRVLVYGVVGAHHAGGDDFHRRGIAAKFSWVLYLFGAFLVFTGLKNDAAGKEEQQDLTNNPVLKWLRRHLRVTDEFHEEKFFIRRNGTLWATPLFWCW